MAFKDLIPTAAQFIAAQNALKARGNPDDPCADCGAARKHHLPNRTFSYAKTGASSGNSRELPVLAPTSCDSPNHLCACVAFREVDDARVPGQWNPALKKPVALAKGSRRKKPDPIFEVSR